jgi:predicted transcriptional regulator
VGAFGDTRMAASKRSRLELYADVLNTLRAHAGGCRITRLSYGANMPLDRMKKVVDELISHGLMTMRADEPGIYAITVRGVEFLDAFKKLIVFLE